MQPRCHRCCRLLLCKAWVFYPHFSLWFAKGRMASHLLSYLICKRFISADDNRQANIDYLVCNGPNFNSHGLRESLLIYEVYCQYGVNFEKWFQDKSQYLSTDPEMKIFIAIRKFHLTDHVNGCFSKWSLNFTKGAGHINGGIMETLWSGLNKVSGAARLMSKAHQQETLDYYMRDSNWKKTVGIGYFLLILFFINILFVSFDSHKKA